MPRISLLKQCLLVGLLACAAGCVGGKPRINDNANIYGDVTQHEALKNLEYIKREYKTYTVIDTFNKVPFYKDVLRKVPKMTADERAAFFKNWAKKRVPGSSAIYVLVYNGAPESHVEVATGRDLNKAFTPADRADLARIYASSLNASDAGPGLLEGIKFMQERLNTNLGGPVTPKPFDWIGFGVIVLVLVSVWLGASLVQAMTTTSYRAAFAGINLAGYGLSAGFLSLATALHAARKRVDATPPPPPPPFQEKPFPEEPEPVRDEHDRPPEVESAALKLHEEAAHAQHEPEVGDEAPRA